MLLSVLELDIGSCFTEFWLDYSTELDCTEPEGKRTIKDTNVSRHGDGSIKLRKSAKSFSH